MIILTATQQNGAVVKGLPTGIAQVLISSPQSGATYTLQVRAPGDAAWTSTDATFSEVFIETFYVSPDLEYRITSTGDVGAVARLIVIGNAGGI